MFSAFFYVRIHCFRNPVKKLAKKKTGPTAYENFLRWIWESIYILWYLPHAPFSWGYIDMFWLWCYQRRFWPNACWNPIILSDTDLFLTLRGCISRFFVIFKFFNYLSIFRKAKDKIEKRASWAYLKSFFEHFETNYVEFETLDF